MGRVIDDATLAEIEKELQGDGVWIDPGFARTHDISAGDEAFLEKTVAEAEAVDLKMVLVDIDRDDDRFQGSFSNLSAWLHDSLGGASTYVGRDEYGSPQLSVHAFGDQPETLHAAEIATRDHPDDFVESVGRLQEVLDDGSAEKLWEQIPLEERYPWTADDGLDDSLSALVDAVPPWAWVVIAVATVAAAVMGTKLIRARRAASSETFVLPPAVLRSVRAAEDRQVRQTAEGVVLALGEALGEQNPAPGSLEVWQQALDHYTAARTVLDSAGSPADVVGALVLARRGDSARRAAVVAGADVAWTPPRTCYFNPLHSPATEEVTWQQGEGSVTVPACAACAAPVRRGDEHGDVLDFIDGDRTVHYFRLDIGAWSQTGYGSLEPDLIGALRRGRRRRRLWPGQSLRS